MSEPTSALALFDGMFCDIARGIMHNEDDLPKLREAILAQEKAHREHVTRQTQVISGLEGEVEQLQRERDDWHREHDEATQLLIVAEEKRDAALQRIAFLREVIRREGVNSDDARTRKQCFAALDVDDKAEKEGGLHAG